VTLRLLHDADTNDTLLFSLSANRTRTNGGNGNFSWTVTAQQSDVSFLACVSDGMDNDREPIQ
jgi:hypothetical protein